MWLQQIGLMSREEVGDRVIDSGWLGDHLVATQTPFGEVEHLPPLTEFSETKAYWDKPPLPPGASRAEWRPDVSRSR